MKSTLEKLNAYGAALTKWNAKKKRIEATNANVGKSKEKPLESEPLPSAFEIALDDIYAIKVRNQILNKPVFVPINLDAQLKPAIKLPVRKI